MEQNPNDEVGHNITHKALQGNRIQTRKVGFRPKLQANAEDNREKHRCTRIEHNTVEAIEAAYSSHHAHEDGAHRASLRDLR